MFSQLVCNKSWNPQADTFLVETLVTLEPLFLLCCHQHGVFSHLCLSFLPPPSLFSSLRLATPTSPQHIFLSTLITCTHLALSITFAMYMYLCVHGSSVFVCALSFQTAGCICQLDRLGVTRWRGNTMYSVTCDMLYPVMVELKYQSFYPNK